MRLRNIPGAREIIESADVVIKPENMEVSVNKIFNNDNPLFIEIGMGKGDFIIELAKNNRDINYIGIEMYSSVLIRAIEKYNIENKNDSIDNLKFLRFDANNLLDIFDDGTVDKIYLNFSDPWPKDRHAKRRLTSYRFLKIYDRILKKDAVIEQKTDNIDLFNFTLKTIEEEGWKIDKYSYDYHSEDYAKDNIMTEYEKKFSSNGVRICFVRFHR